MYLSAFEWKGAHFKLARSLDDSNTWHWEDLSVATGRESSMTSRSVSTSPNTEGKNPEVRLNRSNIYSMIPEFIEIACS